MMLSAYLIQKLINISIDQRKETTVPLNYTDITQFLDENAVIDSPCIFYQYWPYTTYLKILCNPL